MVARESSRFPSVVPRPRHLLIGRVVAVILLVALTIGLTLVFLPLNHSISGVVSTTCYSICDNNTSQYQGYNTIEMPSNLNVAISWQDTSSSLVGFWVFTHLLPMAAASCYSAISSSGTCNFGTGSDGGTFYLLVEDASVSEGTQIVTFSASFTAPIL
jgi:hypothetical protein